MSKLLKFIVHVVVICTMICVLGMAVPPFLGITTVIMDNTQEKETNLPLGSVTYAENVSGKDLAVGDYVLSQDGNKVYRYQISKLDTKEQSCEAIDPEDPKAEALTLSIKDKVPRIVLTIDFIGYLMIATESIEGLIILGLAVLFLIILYVIAELWKRNPQDEEDEEEEMEEIPVKSQRELKKEEKEKMRRLKEENKEMYREEKLRQKSEKKKKKLVKTGGFIDEVYEEDLTTEPPVMEKPAAEPAMVQTATSEAHELLKKEIAAATADEENAKALEEERSKPMEVKKLAIPLYTVEEMQRKVKESGDRPDVFQDDISKVTLFDYSDIIAEEE